VVVNLSWAWRQVRLVREFGPGRDRRFSHFDPIRRTGSVLALVGLVTAIYWLCPRFRESSFQNGEETTMPTATNKGIIDKPSNHSVRADGGKTKKYSAIQGNHSFALVDHSDEAEKIGMKMRPPSC